MRGLNLDLRREGGGRPHYLRLADAVRHAILKGRLLPGERLPATRGLAAAVGAHRQTVMTALQELVAEGWIVAAERRGYVVSATLPSSYFEPKARPPTDNVAAAVSLHKFRFARQVGDAATSPPTLAGFRHVFASGMPDLRRFPASEFRGFLGGALKRPPAKVARLLSYDDSAGYAPLRQELATYLRRLRGLSGRDILITNGSQEGIYLVAQLLVGPGDAVGVEASGYRPAWDALRAAGAKLVPIPVDAEGLDPDAAAKAMRDHKLKMIYVTPLHQYPTTVTLPAPRRFALYDAAVKYGVPLLEDDYDHEFHYRCQPLAPLAAYDPAGLVIYVSTLSKVLFPSARIGFVVPPPALGPALSALRRISSRQNDTLMQDAVASWMKDGGFERHLKRMRRLYEERRDAMDEALRRARDERGLAFDWTLPDGGMALWLDSGQDADRLAAKAAECGVFVAPGSRFRLSSGSSRHLRLGFANQTPRELAVGIRILGEAATKISQ